MRHATPAALVPAEPLLASLRAVPGLVEKRRGVFWKRSRAFLHFHEDDGILYADVRLGEEFERFRVRTPDEQQRLLDLVRAHT